MEFTQERKGELYGFLTLCLAVAAALSLVPLPGNLLGPVGRVLFRIQFGALGFGSLGIPAGLGLWGYARMTRRQVHAPSVKSAGWALALLASVTLLGLA